MRTELKRMDALLAKGNIPKPEVSDRGRDDYDRDRGRDNDRGYQRNARGYKGSSGGYRGRGGGGRGGYRH